MAPPQCGVWLRTGFRSWSRASSSPWQYRQMWKQALFRVTFSRSRLSVHADTSRRQTWSKGTWDLAVRTLHIQWISLFLKFIILMRRNFKNDLTQLFSIFYRFKVEIFYSVELQKVDINRWNKMANIDNCSSCTRGCSPYSSLVLCTIGGFHDESVVCLFCFVKMLGLVPKPPSTSCTALHPPPPKSTPSSTLPNGPPASFISFPSFGPKPVIPLISVICVIFFLFFLEQHMV